MDKYTEVTLGGDLHYFWLLALHITAPESHCAFSSEIGTEERIDYSHSQARQDSSLAHDPQKLTSSLCNACLARLIAT